ncbi:prolipoprotein diacylglyceryl transferase [Candidatus Xianfuyuplasma coldseepsis]|uniref:Phosphatidylglycerol--prolipoprotein diacylglyceryl transferase n=1 Tax=Candidatus Xianfuyuplasma coldseepsis TaxID=2782163 RepID=A0A7L7KSX7_9MOLU|nr:prolipoprotein diacylglyceryl transferase [Xianfuyuplasma coldseepsis]QMS84878.1 prolipoprotein diacylglyceryl transferase [Xianfuyuplasma coldseepsis]
MHVFNPIDPTFITLFDSFSWQKYSLMIMLGLLTAILLGIREGNKLGISTDHILDGVLIIVPLSIVGTRLWYVLFEWGNSYWPYFQTYGFVDGIINVFNIRDGGLAIHGGFITAFVSAYFYTKKRGINIFSVFDIMAPGFLIAQAFGRWGNFFNQEAHGGIIGGTTDGAPALSLDEQREFLSGTLKLPDFITNQMLIEIEPGDPGYLVEDMFGEMVRVNYYHPTFFYESMWNVVGFIIMLILRRTKILTRGDLLPVYLIWYSVGRYFIEGMRTDSLYIGDTNIRTAQVISLVMIAGGIALLALTRTIWPQKKYYEVLAEVAEQNAEQNEVEGV